MGFSSLAIEKQHKKKLALKKVVKTKEITITLDSGLPSGNIVPKSPGSENVLFDAFDNQLNSAVIKKKIIRNQLKVNRLT